MSSDPESSGNLATIAIAVTPFSIKVLPASIKVSGFSMIPPLIFEVSESIIILKGFLVST